MSIPIPTRIERTAAMRALSLDDRIDAINAAPNVLGFDTLAKRAKQVQLAESYRRPPAPAPDGPPLRHG